MNSQPTAGMTGADFNSSLMSKHKHHKKDMDAVLDALDHSDNDVDHPQELLVELQEGFSSDHKRLEKKKYEQDLAKLQSELVKMQYWVKATGYRMIILFEGRDAAGKGGAIKRLTEPMNPRGCRVVALGTPSDQQKTQWYFQRYVEHFPSAGEIVIFDRSWYNRAGVERVMGFATPEQVEQFYVTCPQFERMIVQDGILLLKYWFSVNDEEQEKRFKARIENEETRWKLSPMDIESRNRWVEYSKAKDVMFSKTHIPEAPWFTVEANDKRRARLNCLSHVLNKCPTKT